MPLSNGESTQPHAGNQFGTFAGVFTPCVLTILGVIMFLRFGYVVGQAGVGATLLIVVASNAITVLTALSLSSIATNTKVEGGGAYFLISRSLGPEFGGAIGLVFFAAQALSVAMYVIGFTEAAMIYLPDGTSASTVAVVTNIAVFVSVFIGAGWTLKIQFFILATVIAALVSFYLGAIEAFDWDVFRQNSGTGFTNGENFWTVFALFFPAVTGIMAGANMSGDLANPARSIPRGTLSAIAVTFLVYVSQAFLLGGSRDRALLLSDSLIIADIAVMAALIGGGVIAATLSSALGSMMGAPRILQSLAKDNLFLMLTPLATGSGPASEPRRAILLTFVISTIGILAADLNTIAPLITMAFLVTYGLLNLATFYEGITKNPSYRPQFRFCHPFTSLSGAIGCGVVMVLIDWRWAIVAVVLVAVLHYYLSKRDIATDWGSLQSGLLFERTRRNLMRLEEELYHPKNWRPFVLALSGSGFSRLYLVVMGHWLTSGTGVLTLGQVIPGDLRQRRTQRDSQETLLHSMIREKDLNAFPAVVVASDYTRGVEALVQCQGLGRIRPNLVLLGCPLSRDRMEIFGGLLRNLQGLGRSVIVLRRTDEDRFELGPEDPGLWTAPPGTIDVWWRGRANGELMVLLGHLILDHPDWAGHKLRLLRVVENEAGVAEVQSHLRELLTEARIDGEIKVVVSDDPIRAISWESRAAAFVFFGFAVPEPGEEDGLFDRIEAITRQLPRVALVHSAGEMSLES